MLTGSCLCRAIRYEVSVPVTELRACHCRDCQKSSGAGGYSRRELTPENTSLRIGTLDDSSAMKITAHIWTRSARPWSPIDAAAKQFDGQPDAPATR
jgi:hypothetical protein